MKSGPAIFLLLVLGCTGLEHDPANVSEDAVCGSEPDVDSGGAAFACPWEQQLGNVREHGEVLDESARIRAGGEPTDLVASHRCGEWLLAKDPKGAIVFVSERDGAVRSHGPVHTGFPSSTVSALPLPISLAPSI